MATETKRDLQTIGRNAMDSIRELVDALTVDWDRLQELRDMREGGLEWDDCGEAEELADLERLAGDCSDEDDALDRIMNDPLSLEYRSDWVVANEWSDKLTPTEFRLLLATGGPAVRIVGDLTGNGYDNLKLQVQDWFTPWTDVETTSEDDAALDTYVSALGIGETF